MRWPGRYLSSAAGKELIMRPRKLTAPVTLFAAIDESQYESLRNLAFQQR